MRGLTSALVVGGAGFFGSWLVEALLAEGIDTLVVDERNRPDAVAPAPLLVGEVTELDLVRTIADRKVDVVFQLAGTGLVPLSLEHPIDDLLRNARTTLAVLEAARRCPQPPLVGYVSSAAVYGEGRTMPMTEDHPLEPVSPYGISKLAAEKYVALYAKVYGTPTFSIRPFSLYGPRQRKLVVYDLLVRALAGEGPLVVEAAPDVSRDFVFVEDAARAFLLLARAAPAAGEAYNIASGRPTTLSELTDRLLAAAGQPGPAVFTGTLRPGDPRRWDGDGGRAAALGATCDTPLEVGLAQTVDWLGSEAVLHVGH